MIIALHGETLTTSNLVTHIEVTRDTGYDAIEFGKPQLLRYLDAGFTTDSILDELDGLPVIALGHVRDIERQEPAEYAACWRSARVSAPSPSSCPALTSNSSPARSAPATAKRTPTRG